MRVKAILVTGAAICALSLCAAQAQTSQTGNPETTNPSATDPNVPQESTPAEKQETRQLNEQGINGTTVSPAVLNGEAQAPQPGMHATYQGPEPGDNAPRPATQNSLPPSGTPMSYQQSDEQGPRVVYTQTAQNDAPPQYQDQPPPTDQPAQAYPQTAPAQNEPSYRQQQYDEQTHEYQMQQDQYQAAQRHYRYERAQYDARLRAYDIERYAWAYPRPVLYHYGDEYGLQRLYLIAEPSEQLAGIAIEGPGGEWVGRVRNVDIAPDGRPLRVQVALNRRVWVWVAPGDLRFDPGNRVLYTDLTRAGLWATPDATVMAEPM